MSTTNQTREHVTQKRLDEEKLRKNLKERSLEATDRPHESEIRTEKRELVTEHRLQDDQRQDSMLMRAEEELDE
ncbi:MAG: hypothetical protein AB4040_19665 [Synechococcus sp.]